MIVEWITPDDKGKFVIDGVTLRIKETEKSKYFRMAMRNYPRANAFLAVGSVMIVAGIFLVLGMVGRIELSSIVTELEVWSMKKYLITSLASLAFISLGGLCVSRGMKLSSIYDRWIDEYFE